MDITKNKDTSDGTTDLDLRVLIIASLGFIISTAWSTFFLEFINSKYPPDSSHNLKVKLIYATIVTLFVVGIAFLLKYVFKIGAKVESKIEKDLVTKPLNN